MSAVTALVQALEAWDEGGHVERCQAVEVAAREVGATFGMTVSELLEAVAGARREGAGIGQAVHGVVSVRKAA